MEKTAQKPTDDAVTVGAATMVQKLCIFPIKCYRFVLSPWLGSNCRFSPSCSYYAEEAVTAHGVFRGFFFTFCRLIRCHPFHPGGYDPVPPIDQKNRKK